MLKRISVFVKLEKTGKINPRPGEERKQERVSTVKVKAEIRSATRHKYSGRAQQE